MDRRTTRNPTLLPPNTSTNIRRSTFGGPSEKRQFYIGSFLSQLSESDPNNRYFSKGEFVEIHQILRKETSSSPTLFKLIQSVVDDGTFVDQDTLDCMEMLDSDVRLYDEDSIDQLRQTIEQQSFIQKLTEFNRKQIVERKIVVSSKSTYDNEEDEDEFNQLETLQTCHSLNQQVGEVCTKLLSADLSNQEICFKIVDKICNNLMLNFSEYNCWIRENITEFSRKFSQDIELLTFQMLLEFQKKKQKQMKVSQELLCKTIESNRTIKQKFLLLSKMLCELCKHIEIFEQHHTLYCKNYNIHIEIDLIRNRLNSLYSGLVLTKPNHKITNFSISSTPIERSKSLLLSRNNRCSYDENCNDGLLEFFRKNQSHFDYNLLLSTMQTLKNNLILLQNKIDNNNYISCQTIVE